MARSRPDPPPYWFPLKSNGLGWGLPVTWQGWALMSLLLVPLVIVLPASAWLPERGVAVLAIISIAVSLPTFFIVASRHSEPWTPPPHRGPQPPVGRPNANTDGRRQ